MKSKWGRSRGHAGRDKGIDVQADTMKPGYEHLHKVLVALLRTIFRKSYLNK